MTGHNTDGFTSLSTTAHLTVEGKSTTLTYDSLPKLPLLFTTLGIKSYHTYLGQLQHTHLHAHTSTLMNLSPKQQLKLHLHECCAH